MKIITKLSLSALILAAIVPSCTVEKRVHLPGYHIEWRNGNSKIAANIPMEEIDTVSDNSENAVTIGRTKTQITAESVPQKCIDSTSERTVSGTALTTPQEKNGSGDLTGISDSRSKDSDAKKITHKRHAVPVFVKSRVKKMTAGPNSETAQTNEGGLLKLLGWILILIGLAILLLFSYWIGAITMLLGLVFVLAGASI